MGDDVGLILGLGLDASGVKPGLDQASNDLAAYQQALDDATEREYNQFQKASERLDRGLLSNRETVRLLMEDMGIRLPRAVTSGIAEALPEIAGMGTALMGVFAVEEVFKFSKAALDTMHELQGQTKELEEDWKRVIAEQHKLLVDAKTQEEARRNLDDTNKALAETSRHADDLRKQLADVPPGAALLAAKISLELDKVEAEERRLQDLSVDQLNRVKTFAEQTNKETQHAAEQSVKDAERAATEKYEANQKAFHASEEALKRQMALQEHLGKLAVEEARREEEAKQRAAVAIRRLTEELRKQGEEQTRNAERLGKETAKEIADIERIGNEEEKRALRGKAAARQRIEDEHEAAVALIQEREQEAQVVAMLAGDYKGMADAAVAAYKAMGQASANYLKQLQDLTQAEKQEASAKQQSLQEQAGAIVEQIAELTHNVKLGAEIRGGYDAALAIEWWARFIASYGTDAHAALTAVQYSLAAAEMFEVAGRSGKAPHLGGSTGAEGGGGYHGGGYGGEYGGGGGENYDRERLSTTGLAPGAAGGGGGRLNVYVIGDEAAFIAERVNAADQAGHFMQVTTSRRSSAAQG
jgi:hypothetical protein